MGPPFENGGGRVPLRRNLHDANLASMGPPFENGGGCTGSDRACSPRETASMGPPFENGGGEATRREPAGADLALQWGRRSKTARGAPPRTRAPRTNPASMGPPFENGGG